MKKLIGAAIFGQSGGPSSVINSSAAGVFQTALKEPVITKVYGAAHGIRGMLDEEFYDMSKEDPYEIELLKTTPSSALGSVRYKLKDADVDDTDYKRLLEVFKKYNIRYFFYNGGNDSMDTCNKISKYMQKSGYEMRVMGVPCTAQTIAPDTARPRSTLPRPRWKFTRTHAFMIPVWSQSSKSWDVTQAGSPLPRLSLPTRAWVRI